MASAGFETSAGTEPIQSNADVASVPLPVKIVVAGGYAVGKTTFVGSISDIDPLTTEAALTTVSENVDDEGDASSKTSTTVAMDFGRVALGDELVLYLFGTPGQERFRFMWDELTRGAIGAVVLLDTRRFEDSFGAVEYFEQCQRAVRCRRQRFSRGPASFARGSSHGTRPRT